MTFKRMITAVDTHSGIPMRVITGSVGHIPGASVLEKMRWLEANDDQLRQLVLANRAATRRIAATFWCPPATPRLTRATSSWSRWNIR